MTDLHRTLPYNVNLRSSIKTPNPVPPSPRTSKSSYSTSPKALANLRYLMFLTLPLDLTEDLRGTEPQSVPTTTFIGFIPLPPSSLHHRLVSFQPFKSDRRTSTDVLGTHFYGLTDDNWTLQSTFRVHRYSRLRSWNPVSSQTSHLTTCDSSS